ncbi:thioredoxin [Paenibacillus sp. N1-5-1-14]|uniref:thioredoxin n=1 Tax=Paenibacillus radicibacter TaxID=2972488 RepID=UPI0021594095|nr:thioredoxin [Paenibacillus radicibacter]MCR8641207.1 thioredoxin [Paenibacillus radicibacter]
MNVRPVTNANFKESIRKTGVTLVDFSAAWCPPCKVLLPILEDLSQENRKDVSILKVDCDNEPDLASAFGVMSMPTVVVFQDGVPMEKLVGLRPKSVYQSLITQYRRA